LILVVLFMGGLQLSVLGIVGEYLGSVFDEVKNRPLYVIDEIFRGGSE
jgi:dolichol-phosphate mannosyltransferase